MSLNYSQEVSNDYEELFETGYEYDVIIYAGKVWKKYTHIHLFYVQYKVSIFLIQRSLKNDQKKKMEI